MLILKFSLKTLERSTLYFGVYAKIVFYTSFLVQNGDQISKIDLCSRLIWIFLDRFDQ